MRKITRHWRKRGHPGVNVWVEPVYSLAEPGDPRHGAYQVRSDMVNGMPR